MNQTVRYRFFAGKGGVGKTTCAAAASIAASEAGRAVLIVSTDPAHSLGDALEERLGSRPRGIRTRRGRLEAVELDSDRALERWLSARSGAFRTLVERGTYLDEEDVERLFDLSLPGVDELVGLVELVRLSGTKSYQDVFVDTAPTGHTLRLLAMPRTLRRIAEVLDDMHEKHRFLASRLGGGYRPDRADRVIDEIDEQGQKLEELLRDPRRASFVWVVTPDLMSVEETKDGVLELERDGIRVSEIIVNRLTPAPKGRCAECDARRRAEAEAVGVLERALPRHPLRLLSASDDEPRGVAALSRIGRALGAKQSAVRIARPAREAPSRTAGRGPSDGPTEGRRPPTRPSPIGLERIAPAGVELVLVGGKGGVGKTTCAATIALGLAARSPDKRVLVLSTDPAHSLGDALGIELGDDERRMPRAKGHLFAREIDANRAFATQRERYARGVDELFQSLTRGSSFDVSFDRRVIEDLIDLAPPGIDELFAMLAIVDALEGSARSRSSSRPRARYDQIVVDTAPTGHTLRLLELPDKALSWIHAILAILLKYRKVLGLGELAVDLLDAAKQLRTLRGLMQDGKRTRFVTASRPLELPRLETERLLRSLSKLGIAAPVLIVNGVWQGRCSRCRRHIAADRVEIQLLRRAPGIRTLVLAPAEPRPPRGSARLVDWGRTWKVEAA